VGRFRGAATPADYETQARTLKESAHWYRGVIGSNCAAAL
jgi:beta-glucosidase/6-phospho-beta-glucosidase/beta-galactosidase